MFEGLTARHSVTVIINEELSDDFLGIWSYIGNKLGDAGALLGREIKLHMACHSKNNRKIV